MYARSSAKIATNRQCHSKLTANQHNTHQVVIIGEQLNTVNAKLHVYAHVSRHPVPQNSMPRNVYVQSNPELLVLYRNIQR